MEIDSVHDEEAQRAALQILAAQHPSWTEASDFKHEQEDPQFVALMAYLEQHGLAEVKWVEMHSLSHPVFLLGRITAKGLDFLRPDGGLTAKLGVVTVRLDEATLRALIAQRIDEADLPPEKKEGLRKWLRDASKEALSEATKRLVGAALDHLPDALQLLRTQLG